jgi:hypothetical protein
MCGERKRVKTHTHMANAKLVELLWPLGRVRNLGAPGFTEDFGKLLKNS